MSKGLGIYNSLLLPCDRSRKAEEVYLYIPRPCDNILLDSNRGYGKQLQSIID